MKKIVISVLIIIILFIVFTLLFGKSNSATINDILIDNNYVLDGDIYRKKVTNNTQNDFYDDIKNNKNSEYIEYQYISNTNILKSINLKFDSLYYLCDITEEFSNNEIKYSCNSMYNDFQLNIYGDFNLKKNSLDCYFKNDNITDEISSEYCDKIYNQIQDFVSERNRLLSNKKFKEATS